MTSQRKATSGRNKCAWSLITINDCAHANEEILHLSNYRNIKLETAPKTIVDGKSILCKLSYKCWQSMME